MKKNLMINGARALFIRDSENALDNFDSIVFNGATLLVSDQIYAKLAGKDFQANGASVKVIPTPKDPVYLDQRVTVEGEGQYVGKYLICKELVVAPGASLQGLEGLVVLGNAFFPESMRASEIPQGDIKRQVRYPDDAQLVFDEVWLGGDRSKWRPNTRYFVANRLFALEEGALAALKAQGTAFICERLYTTQRLIDEYADLLLCERLEVVPEDHAVLTRGMPLIELYANGGEKVYLVGDVTIMPDEHRHLALFASIVVKGTVRAQLEHIAQVKAVVKADRIKVYEGIPMPVDGFKMMGHDMFQAALAAGQRYSVEVHGALLLQDDVTAEDVQAICSLTVNGALIAPDATHAHLSGVARSINGAMLPGISELMAMLESMPEETRGKLMGAVPPHIRGMLGLDGDEEKESATTMFNGATYALV